jgi:hypothetical protein
VLRGDELFREVEEELRQERLTAIWKRFGPLVITALVAIVLGVAGWNGWVWWQERQLQSAAAAWDRALAGAAMASESETARALEAYAAGAPVGFAALARLEAAAAHLSATDRAAARDALDAVAGGRVDPIVGEVARLSALALELDTASPQDLIGRLEPLAAAGSPWRHTARELLATALLRAGEAERARAVLRELVDDAETPPSLRARGEELLATLGGARETS